MEKSRESERSARVRADRGSQTSIIPGQRVRSASHSSAAVQNSPHGLRYQIAAAAAAVNAAMRLIVVWGTA
eukprot:4233093-Pleurochrysis_carterae.AAC.1